MIAPEPFFEARGTPFSEFHRIRALTALGHDVDLVTYPFGRSVEMPRLRIFRSLRPPFIHRVKIGPSLAKIPLDILLAITACRRALSGRYDAIHSHEEGGAIGVILAALLRKPHLYDMHSSLPQQLSNFAFSGSRVLRRMFATLERVMIRRSRVVIVICPSLEDTVHGIDRAARTVLIENAPGAGNAAATAVDGAHIRERHGIKNGTPLVVYTGTFEAYQGLDLLFDAMAIVRRTCPSAHLLVAGGDPEQIAAARRQVDAARIGDAATFAGDRPAEEIPAYLTAADVLVSSRSRGTNTPLKIYQYLRAGKPIVATRLLTHTQVLTDDTAILTGATRDEFAAGIVAAITDRTRALVVASNARTLAITKYSDEAYLERTRQACAALFGEIDQQQGQVGQVGQVGRVGS